MTRALESPARADWIARRRRRESLLAFFTSDEIQRLEEARTRVDARHATIAYCVYENPFARGGGVFAVAENYCGHLGRRKAAIPRGASSETDTATHDVLAISPLHSRLKTAPPANSLRPVGRCYAPFGGRSIEVLLYEHIRNHVRWILLGSPGFFQGEGGPSGTDPYLTADPGQLLTDCLLFSAAVPYALAALGQRQELIVHLQDWETASTALTVKSALLDGTLESAAVLLTSHNPYDQGLQRHHIAAISRHTFEGLERLHTVYQYMLPLTDAPISTVSRTFAQELCHDPLQREVFADHLQGTFRSHGLVGVDNGLFGPLQPPYSTQLMRAAEHGQPEAILEQKLAQRRALLEVVADYRDERIIGRLAGASPDDPPTTLPDQTPIFLMFGRLDPAQKGFDVLCRAIEALPRGRARWIFTPIVSSAVPRAFVDDLSQLAAARAGEVIVYPFRMERGYREAMGGATFAVMPSLYEPFGGATEPYLAGTPVVARATGGLVQQVVDIDMQPQDGTGILYHEHGDPSGWRAVQAARSPAERMAVPIYGAMVAALAAALTRAGDLYRAQPQLYAHLLAAGYPMAERFSWEQTAAGYQQLYDLATQ